MDKSKQEERRKPLWYDQPNFKEFKEGYDAEGARPLLFIGSGLSISAGFPNWPELLRRLRIDANDLVKFSPKFDADFDKKLKGRKYAEAGSILKKAFVDSRIH